MRADATLPSDPHLDDERIERALHGELDGAARTAVDRHVGDCASCRLRLEEAGREERWVFDLLSRIDRAAPAVDAGDVVRRANRGLVEVWAKRAAVVLLATAVAGAAYTAPGSPVRGWVDRVAGWIGSPAPRAPSEEPATVATAGIAVAPGDRLSIRFAAAQSAGTAAVLLTAGPDVVARARNGEATFATDAERLTIANEGSTADYEIEVPRGAPWVELQVAGRRVFLKQGAKVTTEAPADARGRYLIRLAPGP